MPIQNNYFDADALMEKVKAEKMSGEQLALTLESEIARSEQLKIMLVEGIEQNPEPTVRIINDIDSYIYKIQDLLAGLAADRYSREVLSTNRMQLIREKILKILSQGNL